MTLNKNLSIKMISYINIHSIFNSGRTCEIYIHVFSNFLSHHCLGQRPAKPHIYIYIYIYIYIFISTYLYKQDLAQHQFGLILWLINHSKLFNAKSLSLFLSLSLSLSIYIYIYIYIYINTQFYFKQFSLV